MSAQPPVPESTQIEAVIPYRLLLIQDDAGGAAEIQSLLNKMRHVVPFDVSHAIRLDEAIDLQGRLPHDVALLDLALPGAGGLDAVERLRRSAPALPVVALAAAPRDCTPPQAFQRGAYDLLVRQGLDAYLLIRSLRYAAERRRMKEALRNRKDKLAQYQGVLLELAKTEAPDLDSALRRLIEASARSLGVERVSAWFYTEDRSAISCSALFRLSQRTFEKGVVLHAKDYPRYFQTLMESRLIPAHDACRDPRTSEFADGYLQPLGITSMMDVPIRLHGQLIGIICHEHTGPLREWLLEEQEFASSIADMASLAVESSERRRVEEALREERNFVNAVLDTTATMVAVLDAQGRVVRLNRACESTLGRPSAEALGRLFWNLYFREEDRRPVSELFTRPPACAATSRHEHPWICPDETSRRVDWIKTPLFGPGGAPRNFVVTAVDITDRKALEDQLIHDAFHDPLTGLPNRALFTDRLDHCMSHEGRGRGRNYAVIHLDIDRFKVVNDGLGPAGGDRLLLDFARRLEEAVRPGDTVARFGGDEFGVLLEDVAEAADVLHVARKIQDRLKLPFKVADRELFVSASAGIALSGTGYERAEDVLRDADTALYRAKGRGGARHEVFDKAMHARAVELLKMETDLRRALDLGQFTVHYQPVVALRDGTLAGFEALVRWHHPERGLLPPMEFIPMAEESGLIVPLDRWVLREACRQLKDWHGKFPRTRPLFVSVNLSGKQFTQPDLSAHVSETLRATGLPGDSLGLELTESVLLDCSRATTDVLGDLRTHGPRLYLDDFGTGYSSLGYLHRFPIDSLKIDRSFVGGIRPDGQGESIVRTIVTLAQNLDIHTVAEGVEESHQILALREIRCEFAQGFAFSRPVPGEEAEAMLADKRSW